MIDSFRLLKTLPARSSRLLTIQIFSIIFTALFVLHAPLLRLPFFWDEAGLYIPTAHDLVQFHSLIPKTTMDSGHPPLSAAYLALWFTLSGWKAAVARTAMLLLAAFALINVFLLARRVSKLGVAVAATIATALYPVFFVQSSLAHADLAAAAFTLWGIRLGIERRLWTCQLAFSLAVLSKETAVVTPIALAIWEFFLAPEAGSKTERLRHGMIRLFPVLPLALWILYHHHMTGRFFGGAAFYEYNVANTVSLTRFLLAFVVRLWHLFGYMNMLALTAATVAAMWFLPVQGRERIAISVQLQFAAIMLANLIAFSVVGGSLLTRYILPLYPLLIIIAMSTLHRRIGQWEWPAGLVVICFVLALFFDPPHSIAFEDNLTYKAIVELHVRASRFLEQHEQGKTVLTAWPASDELRRTYLGYVNKPLPLVEVLDFSLPEVFKARGLRSQYQVAFVFSTKYDHPLWFGSKSMENLSRRYLDYHSDMPPEAIANLLGGKIVFLERKRAEWAAILEIAEAGTKATIGSPPSPIPAKGKHVLRAGHQVMERGAARTLNQ